MGLGVAAAVLLSWGLFPHSSAMVDLASSAALSETSVKALGDSMLDISVW